MAGQINNFSGLACLQSVYNQFNDNISLQHLRSEMKGSTHEGTNLIYLANHALCRDYSAVMYTFDHEVFDPEWFKGGNDLVKALLRQRQNKPSDWIHWVIGGYVKFILKGGKIRFGKLIPALILDALDNGLPVLAKVNATYLYSDELDDSDPEDLLEDDDEAEIHTVVIYDRDARTGQLFLLDPKLNSQSTGKHFAVRAQLLMNAIQLSSDRDDAALLVIKPD